jgi:hypothetical protein
MLNIANGKYVLEPLDFLPPNRIFIEIRFFIETSTVALANARVSSIIL